ncbi:MAG: hypothetical protein PHO79_07205, partial [Desulfoplanes sp.]|nr:hypothetical protein [Desulfoplanes sp.]
CREYSMGIKIEQVVLQDVNPPEPVKAAFNAVNEAQQEKETLIICLQCNHSQIVPANKKFETVRCVHCGADIPPKKHLPGD